MSRGSNLKRKQKRKNLAPAKRIKTDRPDLSVSNVGSVGNSNNTNYVAVGVEGWKKENRKQWSELNAAKVMSELFDEIYELKETLDSEVLSIGKNNMEAIILEGVDLVLDLYKTADEEFNRNVPWITNTFMNSALAPPSSDAKIFKRVDEFIEFLDFTRASLRAMVTKIKTGENTVWEIGD